MKQKNGTKQPKKKKRPVWKWLIAAGLVFCAVLIVFLIARYRVFHNYKTEISDARENTLVYSYYAYNGNVLKCASDTASLTDIQNETIWTITYEMSNPQVAKSTGAFAIYDKNGTSVYICDESGIRTSFHTDLPIQKAKMAGQGTLAVLMDDGSTAQIDYYDADGGQIATIRTTLDKEGYPMDIALSENGILLGVSYLRYEEGTYTTDICFYSFGTAGQLSSDNIVSSYSYAGTIVPQLEFMGSDGCVAFGTDKIAVYQGGRTPQEINVISPGREIQSTFVLENSFGIVLEEESREGSDILVYNKKGGEKAAISTDFAYTSMDAADNRIVLYNRNALCVYTADGILKFRKETDFFIRQLGYIGANRFVLAATDSYNIIRLY